MSEDDLMFGPCDCGVEGEKVDAASGDNILNLVPGVAFHYVCPECKTSWLPAKEEAKIDKYLNGGFGSVD